MQARTKLKPGQQGTRRLVELYGRRLLRVCCRYNEQRQKRYKTVELIIEEADWQPKPKRIKPETIVNLRIAFGEVEPGRKVKAADSKWNAAKGVWELRYDQVAALGLEECIVQKASNTRNLSKLEPQAKATNTRNQKASNI